MNNVKKGEIRTFTGQYINVLDPDPEKIKIEDIAHGLSNACRFAGQTKVFYSVAQHSIMCSNFSSTKNKLAALLHDASEAYLLDMPKPIKICLPDYEEIENNLMLIIANKFGFKYPLSDRVKEVDKNLLELEWNNLMIREPIREVEKKLFAIINPIEIEKEFLEKFNSIIESKKKRDNKKIHNHI